MTNRRTVDRELMRLAEEFARYPGEETGEEFLTLVNRSYGPGDHAVGKVRVTVWEAYFRGVLVRTMTAFYPGERPDVWAGCVQRRFPVG